MNVVTLNKKSLSEFIKSDNFNSLPNLPISFQRAVSHINNPRANDDDVLLILIYNELGIAGYLGIIPDNIFINDSVCKIGWMSCIWVHKNSRGMGIAKQLTLLSAKYYNNKIFATEFTPTAYNLYKKLNIFNDFVNLNGVRVFRQFYLSEVLINKFHFLKHFKPFFKFTDNVLNFFVKLFYKKNNLSKFKNYTIEKTENINNELENFISENSNSVFKRFANELNWILNFKWVNEVKEISDASSRYQFTSEAKQFSNICYTIKYDNVITTFVMFTIRDSHLKIPYLFSNKIDNHLLLALVNNVIIENNVKIFTSYYNCYNNVFKNLSCVYKKHIIRKYLTTTNFKTTPEFVCDGDGDCAFV